MIVSVVLIYDAYLGDLFIRLTFPPLIRSLGTTVVFRVCLVDPRCGLQQDNNNIPMLYSSDMCSNVEPAQLHSRTASPLPCETHSAQRPSITLVGD